MPYPSHTCSRPAVSGTKATGWSQIGWSVGRYFDGEERDCGTGREDREVVDTALRAASWIVGSSPAGVMARLRPQGHCRKHAMPWWRAERLSVNRHLIYVDLCVSH